MRAGLLLGPPVLLLAGCAAGPVEVSDPAPDQVAHPVVAVGQAGRVLDAVESALLDKGTGDDDRLIGPYRELARAQAQIATAQKAELPDPADVDRLRLIVPTNRGWPRFFVTVGNTSATSTPVLRVLSSSGPRAPYGLWAEPMMLPGATLPETAAAATGTAQVDPEADGLVATPKEVVSDFAGYLNAGTSAKTKAFEQQFEPSAFSDQLRQRLIEDRKELATVATVSSKHTVGESAPLSLRTADGGALVFGELRQEYKITAKKGQKVTITDKNLAALAGGQDKIKKSLKRTAVEIVVLKVPARGQGLVTVIAAQKGDVKAVLT